MKHVSMRFKVIIRCGPCEDYVGRCIRSLINQDDQGWDAIIMVDPCGDDTYERAKLAVGKNKKISIVLNSDRVEGLVNTFRAIAHMEAKPEDVIVDLDGDDWFNQDSALSQIREVYDRDKCWMTYGSWITRDPKLGMWPAYDEKTHNFRQTSWRGTAVRTRKKWLLDLIRDEDFRDQNGNYFKVPYDLAEMFPLLEMSGTERAVHIASPLYFYNSKNPASTSKTKHIELRQNALYIRSRSPYPRLDPDLPNHESYVELIGSFDRSNEKETALFKSTAIQLLIRAIRANNSESISRVELERELLSLKQFSKLDETKQRESIQFGLEFLKNYKIAISDGNKIDVQMPDRIEYYDVLELSD